MEAYSSLHTAARHELYVDEKCVFSKFASSQNHYKNSNCCHSAIFDYDQPQHLIHSSMSSSHTRCHEIAQELCNAVCKHQDRHDYFLAEVVIFTMVQEHL